VSLRVAVLGAFPFPLPQGSQVFARDQACALQRAGADVRLLCYGRGRGPAPAELALERIPGWLSPRRLRAGPSPGKPLADAALVALTLASHRRRPFEVVLAHNAEAALVALCARPLTGVPVLYVAHTLLRHELASYGPRGLRAGLDGLGRALDAWIARRADGVIALCAEAGRALAAAPGARVEVIPPGLEPGPAPGADRVARSCGRFGLEPGRYALYAGNLDAYQNLRELDLAARELAELPVIVATHATDAPPLRALRVLRVDRDEARELCYGAAVALLPRRHPGGFPIKLLNYLEAARPVVAYAGSAPGLEHDRSAWLVSPEQGARGLAQAVRRLLADPERARRLGQAARALLEAQHAWPELAARTLAFARSVRSAAGRGSTG
jgi:glycosyltransferase involved in cell wall biosynthesis